MLYPIKNIYLLLAPIQFIERCHRTYVVMKYGESNGAFIYHWPDQLARTDCTDLKDKFYRIDCLVLRMFS